ncbi:hypothetical protein WJX73_005167 [Symbiochloris irregularis]|uniref:TFIIS central domain-containing protein n=1 Tax=Symbiochloris irregularis TaxID=706552 RepID=A0AAW1NQI7_9CHLO
MCRKDLKSAIVGSEICTLWPDNGVWYTGVVEELTVKKLTAKVAYTVTDEVEILKLGELIDAKQIAFKEKHAASYEAKRSEIVVDNSQLDVPIDSIPDDNTAQAAGRDRSKRVRKADSQSPEEEEQEISEEAADGTDPMEQEGNEDKSSEADSDTPMEEPGLAAQRSRRAVVPSQKARDALRSSEEAAPQPPPKARQASAEGRAPSVPKKSDSVEHSAADKGKMPASAAAAGKAPGDHEDFNKAEAYSRDFMANLLEMRARADSNKSAGVSNKDFYGSGAKAGPGLKQHHSQTLSEQTEGSGSSAPLQSKSSSFRPLGARPPAEVNVREKTQVQFAQALQKAVEEQGKEAEGIDVNKVAHDVEVELFKLFGNSGKEYRTKFRTLWFNLNDSANPALRARLLQGDLEPHKFVRLTANELASRELSQWRNEKAEEAMRQTVLDDAAAARFSTAAALEAGKARSIGVDWRDSTLQQREVVAPSQQRRRERADSPDDDEARADKPSEAADEAQRAAEVTPAQPSEEGSGLAAEVKEERAKTPDADARADAEPVKAEQHTSPTPTETQLKPALPTPPPAAPAPVTFDWASVKAKAEQAATEDPEEAADGFLSFDSYPADDLEAAADKPAADHVPDANGAPDSPTPTMDGADVEDEFSEDELSKLMAVLAPGSGHDLNKQAWEGTLTAPQVGEMRIAASSAAGLQQLGSVFPAEVEIKGRVRLEHLAHFLEQLQGSRSRTVSLAVARHAEEVSLELVRGLASSYSRHSRTGVAQVSETVEVYFVAQCTLAAKLLQAAAKMQSNISGQPSTLPAHVTAEQFLLVIIHRKELLSSAGLSTLEAGQASSLPAPALSLGMDQAQAAPTVSSPARSYNPRDPRARATVPGLQQAVPGVSLPDASEGLLGPAPKGLLPQPEQVARNVQHLPPPSPSPQYAPGVMQQPYTPAQNAHFAGPAPQHHHQYGQPGMTPPGQHMMPPGAPPRPAALHPMAYPIAPGPPARPPAQQPGGRHARPNLHWNG